MSVFTNNQSMHAFVELTHKPCLISVCTFSTQKIRFKTITWEVVSFFCQLSICTRRVHRLNSTTVRHLGYERS